MRKILFLALAFVLLIVSSASALELPSYSGTRLTSSDIKAYVEDFYNGISFDEEPEIDSEFSLTVAGANINVPSALNIPCDLGAFTIHYKILSEDVSGDETVNTYVDTSKEVNMIMMQLALDSGTFTKANGSDRHFVVNNSGTLTVNSGVTLDGGGTGGGIRYNGGNLAIEGVTFNNNHADNGGALYLGSGTSLMLNGSNTFTNNSASESGGAIYNAGTLTFSEAITFSKNEASGNDGGAIYSSGNLTFSGTANFDTNKANGSGGGIYNASTLTFADSVTFSINTASGDGGAIYSSGIVRLVGTDNKFTTNTATNGSGGAIYYSATGSLEFGSNYTFNGNNASADGGAVYSQVNVTVSGANFTGTGSNARGGAVYSTKTVNVSSGNFVSFNTSESGGAIYADGAVNIEGGSFSECTSGSGGAIYSNGLVTISSGDFSQCGATNFGGVIYANSSAKPNLKITGGTFTKETANYGGVAFSASGVDIEGGTFGGSNTDKNSALNGAVIYASGDVDVSGGTFDSNESTGNNDSGSGGGVIFAAGEIGVSGGTFTRNTADSAKGGVFYGLSNIDISGGTFGGSKADKNSASSGGVVYSDSDVNISGGEFVSNDATGTATRSGGGAIYASGDVSITGTPNFAGNSSSRYGGAIYTNGDLTLNGNIIFEGNKSESYGGAIYALGTISGNTSSYLPIFTGNVAESRGGAIYTDANITLENVSFDNNSSNEGGGGAVYTSKKATFTNSTFTNNIAAGDDARGGAIFADGSVSITSSTLTNNSAISDGGAIHTGLDGTSSITKSVFKNNIASETGIGSGGAIYLDNSNPQHNFTITDSIFLNNRAQAQGGALRIDGNSVTITRCYFYENQSDSAMNGGAAYLAAAKIVVVNSTFYKNTTLGGDGGALYLDDLSDPGDATTSAALLVNTFVGNNCGAGRGGALYVTRENETEMFGNLLVGNEAPERSGKDVFVEQGKRIRSRGYNILTNIGVLTSGSASTVNWKNTSFVIGNYAKDEITGYDVTYFFEYSGEEIVRDTSPTIKIGANDTETLYALHLNYGDGVSNVALGFVQNDAAKEQFRAKNITQYTDALGNSRPASYNWDAGSRQLSNGISSPEEEEVKNTNLITAIKISGLPVTLRRVGQTASLVVYGLDAGGNVISRDMNVTWTYDDYFVRIYDDNTIVAMNLTTQEPGGYTEITATAATPAGDRVDTRRIKITEAASQGRYSNISSKYLEEIGDFNASSTYSSVAIGNSAAKSSTLDLVQAASFQTAFQETYPGAATLVTQVENIGDDVDFAVEANSDVVDYSDSEKFVAAKDGIDIMINGRSKGDVLPVEYSWIYTREELQNLLGTKYSPENLNAENLQDVLRVAFKTDNSVYVPVIGSNAVSLQDAFAANSLSIDTDNEDNPGGAVIRFTAYLANIASNKTQLVNSTANNKLLIVPDGIDSDTRIAGTMFMLQKKLDVANSGGGSHDGSGDRTNDGSSGGNSMSKSGGGGGCNNFAMSGLLALLFLLRKSRR